MPLTDENKEKNAENLKKSEEEDWKWEVEGIHYLKHTTNKPSFGGCFKNWILRS